MEPFNLTARARWSVARTTAASGGGTIVRALALLLLIGSSVPPPAAAQSDEIQVYDGGLAAPGVINLTWHNNFTPDGIKEPAFPGAVTSNKSFNGVSEWAYGVTRWFEAGLYLPLYSHDDRLGWELEGFKLRTLFAAPNAADRTFVYGVNLEYSFNARDWDTSRLTSEIRPIIGWHLNRVDLIVNPIFDTKYDGLGNLEFVPSVRAAWNTTPHWAVALEEYADYGRLGALAPIRNQAHQVFAVIDHTGAFEIEAGIGIGLTDASDRLQFKLIIARDLKRARAK